MTTNDHYPGRPNYVGPVQGICIGVHHNILAEWAWDIRERIAYIRENKPDHEILWRLWQLVMLSDEDLAEYPAVETWAKAWLRARDTAVKARNATTKAWNEMDKAKGMAWDKEEEAWNEVDKARNVALEARGAAVRARDTADTAWVEAAPHLLALVNKFVPDNTWNGAEFCYTDIPSKE
jgi:hypothetical protein